MLWAMLTGFQTLSWKTLGRGVAIAYGISFLSGLVFFANEITPQTDQILYPLLALLSGAIGVAVALRMMGTTRPAYLITLGIGLWLINLSSVLLSAQTLIGWLDSSMFIATTVILGRLLLGPGLDTSPPSKPSRTKLGSRYAHSLRSHQE